MADKALTTLTETERLTSHINALLSDLNQKRLQLSDMQIYAQHLEAEVVKLKDELAKKK